MIEIKIIILDWLKMYLFLIILIKLKQKKSISHIEVETPKY